MGSRRQWLWASVTAAAALLGFSASAEGGFRRYLQLSRDINTVKARNAQTAADNARLLAEIEALRNDPKAQERAAREELGFVKPGEVIINLETP